MSSDSEASEAPPLTSDSTEDAPVAAAINPSVVAALFARPPRAHRRTRPSSAAAATPCPSANMAIHTLQAAAVAATTAMALQGHLSVDPDMTEEQLEEMVSAARAAHMLATCSFIADSDCLLCVVGGGSTVAEG